MTSGRRHLLGVRILLRRDTPAKLGKAMSGTKERLHRWTSRFRDRDGVYPKSHLYRLSPEIESAIEALRRGDGMGTHIDVTVGQTLEEIVEQRAAIGIPPDHSAAGPIRCGGIGELARPEGVARMAGVYAEAFRAKHIAVPYFTEAAAE